MSKKHISARLEVSTITAIKEKAKIENRSVNNMIDELLKRQLRVGSK